MMNERVYGAILVFVGAGALLGCRGETLPAPPTTATAPPLALAPSVPIAPREPIVAVAPALDAEGLRDPFERPTGPVAPPPIPLRRTRRFAVEDLKLIGVAGRGRDSHALLRDPTGRGWVVAPGELVGRPESRGGALASWRVDRIREHDVVLALEANDGHEAATKVLALPVEALIDAQD